MPSTAITSTIDPTKDRMNETLQTLMREATRLTQAGRLHEATQTLQRALGGRPGGNTTATASSDDRSLILDGCTFETSERTTTQQPPEQFDCARPDAGLGSFTADTHVHAGLTRRYKLYTPPLCTSQPALALVVMLHGCTQNADDFAAGTGMNELAREQGFIVLYPEQAKDANPQRCWNWFKHNHQRRGSGEPALIASLTQKLVQVHGINPRRVYIAGLSAGGAMAANVAAAYPDVFAAAGVHSGLPAGSARSVAEAMVQMQSGANAGGRSEQAVPTIVFHGDQDRTVNPRNGEQVLAAALHDQAYGGTWGAGAVPYPGRAAHGVSSGGRRYTRTDYSDGAGAPLAEHWVIHGAGHAWSGGQPTGSYTEPTGPDATREMLRFFFSQPSGLSH